MERSLRRPVEQDRPHRRDDDDHNRRTDDDPQEMAHRPTVAWSAVPTLRSIAPIFPTGDLEAMRTHYEALGFEVQVHGGGYGTAARDDVRIHFRQEPDAAAGRVAADGERGAAYIAVDDADALHAEWRAAGVGETGELFDPGFGVWEAAHTDPDGNLLRFGSQRGAASAPGPP